MKLLILRSVQNSPTKDPYSVSMDTLYADRLIGHLTDKGKYCKSCQDKCIACRKKYDLDYSEHLAGVIEFPAVLPFMIDEPDEYLPESVPDCDVVIAVAVNEELLLRFVERFGEYRGLVVPIERSDTITPNYIRKITGVCRDKGIEAAFPKPFCSFKPESGVLAEFRKEFRIGKPEVEYTVEDGVIGGTKVLVSAPCGATYYSCRGIMDKRKDDDLIFIIDNRLSAYPCTADHAVDREFNDSITHKAVQIQRDMLDPLKDDRF